MSLKFYAEPGSQPSRSVNYVLQKLGIEHEYIETLVFTGTGTEEFKKINPLAKIPVITDGDFTLRESGAIVFYLCDNTEGGDKLLPREDQKARSRVVQWIFWNSGEGRPGIIPALRRLVIYPLFFKKPKPDEEETKELMGTLNAQFQAVENQLSETEWLAGDEFSLADVYIYNELQTAVFILQMDLKDFPKVSAWMETLEKDEIIAKIKTEAAESMAARMG